MLTFEPTLGCVTESAIFQDPLVEDTPSRLTSVARCRQDMLLAKAANICATCPVFDKCLYDAVVKHDVSGFLAGTTQEQRNEIRRQLNINVEAENLDIFIGVFTPNRQIDHNEVLRLRNTNPHYSIDTIAHRLGCSISTIKRHLRKDRDEPAPAPAVIPVPPSMEQVKQAYVEVVHRDATNSIAA